MTDSVPFRSCSGDDGGLGDGGGGLGDGGLGGGGDADGGEGLGGGGDGDCGDGLGGGSDGGAGEGLGVQKPQVRSQISMKCVCVHFVIFSENVPTSFWQ